MEKHGGQGVTNASRRRYRGVGSHLFCSMFALADLLHGFREGLARDQSTQKKKRIVCGQATKRNGTAICHLLSDELKSLCLCFFSLLLGDPPLSHHPYRIPVVLVLHMCHQTPLYTYMIVPPAGASTGSRWATRAPCARARAGCRESIVGGSRVDQARPDWRGL